MKTTLLWLFLVPTLCVAASNLQRPSALPGWSSARFATRSVETGDPTQSVGSRTQVRSSIQVGEWIPSEFHPLNVTGKHAAKKHCLVCENGVNPVVLIFARRLDDPLLRLLTQLDAVTGQHRDRDMGSFVVFLNTGPELHKSVEDAGGKSAFKHLVLSVEKGAGPKDYKIAADADITVLIYREFIVKANHAFRKGELTDEAIASVLADLPKIGVAKEPEIIPAGAKIEKVASGCRFTEGPAADREGNLFFTDSPRNLILVLRSSGKLETWNAKSDDANGMRFDAKGRLIACCGEDGARAVVRYDVMTGGRTILADKYQGKRLTAPNDLCIDRRGRIWFTDPCYGKKPKDGQERYAVYRIDAKEGEPIVSQLTRVIDDVDTPNGICISPDEKTLYVADNAARRDGPHTLLAYDVAADGTCKRRKVLHDFGQGRGIDGMVLDRNGNIYATAESGPKTGVYIFNPAGKQLGFIPTPETATNCTFGDKDLRTLYITAGTSLYKIRLNAVGYLAFP